MFLQLLLAEFMGAYVLGWLLCNLFVVQLADRVAKKLDSRRKQEFIEQIADEVASRFKPVVRR